MSSNKTKVAGYDGPLGWPDTSNNWNILKEYTRTEHEATEVTLLDSDVDGIYDSGNVDWDVASSKGRALLAIKYQIDAYWEELSSLVVDFASKYNVDENGEGLDVETQNEYDTAMSAILKIQGYIAIIDKLYQTIFDAAEEVGDLEYSTINGYVWYYSSNNAVLKVLDNSKRNYTEDSGAGDSKKKISTGYSYYFFQSYSTWANNVQSQLKSIGTYDEESNTVKAFYDYEGDYPRSKELGNRDQNLQQFKEDVYMLDKLMAQRAIRSVWVFLQIGNIKFSTWDQSNYITDFDYKKNGSGCANSFTFNLTYVPAPGDENINRLEKILSKRKVFFQYGYNEQYILCSPQYQGEILQYSVSTENNTIKYSLVGYSEVVEARFIDIESWPGYGARAETDDGSEGDLGFGVKATVYAEQLLNTYLPAYGYKIVNEAVNDDQPTVIPATEGNVFECAQTILSYAKLSDDLQKKVDEAQAKQEKLEKQSGVDLDNNTTETTSYFTYVIDDKKDDEGWKTITIIRSKHLKELDTNDINVAIAFAYGGSDSTQEIAISDLGADLSAEDEEQQQWIDEYYNNNLKNVYTKGTFQMLSNMITSFTTSYDGAVTISNAYIESSEQLRINDNGELITTYVLGDSKSTTGSTNIQDERYSYWLWERNTMYSYDATLTMLGVPSDIPIGTYIYIRPLINGFEHHTGGFYYITGSEDKINQQGYTTTLKLLRVIDQDTDEILEGIEKLKREAATKRLRESGAGRSEYVEELGEDYGDYAWKDARVDDAFDTYSEDADPRISG